MALLLVVINTHSHLADAKTEILRGISVGGTYSFYTSQLGHALNSRGGYGIEFELTPFTFLLEYLTWHRFNLLRHLEVPIGFQAGLARATPLARIVMNNKMVTLDQELAGIGNVYLGFRYHIWLSPRFSIYPMLAWNISGLWFGKTIDNKHGTDWYSGLLAGGGVNALIKEWDRFLHFGLRLDAIFRLHRLGNEQNSLKGDSITVGLWTYFIFRSEKF